MGRYIEGALARAGEAVRREWRDALEALDDLARRREGDAFASLAPDAQDRVLELVRTGRSSRSSGSARSRACSATPRGAATSTARAGGCSATPVRASCGASRISASPRSRRRRDRCPDRRSGRCRRDRGGRPHPRGTRGGRAGGRPAPGLHGDDTGRDPQRRARLALRAEGAWRASDLARGRVERGRRLAMAPADGERRRGLDGALPGAQRALPPVELRGAELDDRPLRRVGHPRRVDDRRLATRLRRARAVLRRRRAGDRGGRAGRQRGGSSPTRRQRVRGRARTRLPDAAAAAQRLDRAHRSGCAGARLAPVPGAGGDQLRALQRQLSRARTAGSARTTAATATPRARPTRR